ncbi:acyl carrier protein [Nocardioides humi]|uniref:acyl carrier protein n=1 Tax=Nocardioides humi TaxID=449461 RepID=UPI0015E85E83|nr:acyl carrier protein [Nocardioides humi]
MENYPRPDADDDRPVAVVPLSGQDGTGYPVTLTVQPGDRLAWEVEGRHPELTTALLAGLEEAFEVALVALLDDATVPAPEFLSAPRLPVRPAPLAPPAAATAPVERPADAGAADALDAAARAAARVLGVDELAPDADFFAHGGDSIAAIALVGALRSAGLVVGVRAVFEGRTPAGIVALATTAARPASASGPGELPLTPALSWFVQHAEPARRQGFQQVLVLAVPADVTDQAWAEALDALAARHAGLRLALRGDRAEVLEHVPGTVLAGAGDDPVALTRRLAAGIDPEQGVVLRAGLVRSEDAEDTAQLVLVAHHIAVDAVSWRILTDDLRALVAGERLPEPGGIRDWAMAQHAAAPRLAERIDRWEAALPADALDLRTAPSARLGSVGEAAEVAVELTAEETDRFLAHTAAGTAPDHLLVAALAAAAGRTVVVEAEGHGRDLELPDAADPADTVGWLTATWPVPVTPAAHPAGTFAAAAAALDVTDGPEYGVLRHLLPEGRERLGAREDAHPPQVLVNYLGREALGTGPWQPSLDSAAVESALGLHDGLPASHPLELNAYVAGDRLVARWQVASGAAPAARALVDRWAEELRQLLACGPDELAATRTPYDAAGIGPDAITALLAEHPEVADVEALWPLTPVQRGMWFHAVTDEVDGYTSAVALDLHGPLDAGRLRRALDAVVARHPQLRLGVLPLADGAPVAVSRRDLRAAWRATEEPSLDDARRQELLTAHEREPFELTGPLLRAHLVRLDAEHHHLVLANHHLLLDGWSVPLLVRELLETYVADTAPSAVPDPRRTGLARLAAWQQAHPADAEAWRDRLSGAAPTLLAGPEAEPADAAVVRPLDEGWQAVEQAARAADVTVSTLVTTAWTVVLGALTGHDDVVTGTVVAGRPGDLPGADELLGMFVTTLPVRARWDAATTGAALLAQAGADAIGRLDAGPVALGDLHRVAGVPTLFDSLVVVENYPHDPDDQPASAAGLSVGAIEGVDATHYPLSLTMEPGESLRLEYAAGVLGEHAPAVLDAVVEAATVLVTELDRPVAELAAALRDRLAPVVATLPAATATGPAADGAVDPERLTDVRTAFATALGLADVAPDDDFFALGGDSIVAMRVVSALREHGLVVRPKALFSAPTPVGLAALVTTVTPAEPEPAPAPAAPGSLLDFDPTSALEDLLRNP